MELLSLLLAKLKFVLLGAFGGTIMYLFEMQTTHAKFSVIKCITSSIMIGALTELSRMVIFGWFLEQTKNEDKVVVLSLGLACLLYLLIPFVLSNREEFIRFVLSKFGYEKNIK